MFHSIGTRFQTLGPETERNEPSLAQTLAFRARARDELQARVGQLAREPVQASTNCPRWTCRRSKRRSSSTVTCVQLEIQSEVVLEDKEEWEQGGRATCSELGWTQVGSSRTVKRLRPWLWKRGGLLSLQGI